jgi:hypothetical protein
MTRLLHYGVFASQVLPHKGLELRGHITALSKERKRNGRFALNAGGFLDWREPCLHFGAGGAESR